MRCALLVLPFVLAAEAFCAAAAIDLPQRRRSQFMNDPGYAAFPYVYSLPGIGLGVGVLGAATNVGRTTTDIVATAFTGDANGQAFGVDALQLLPQRLIADFGGAHLSRTTLQSYSLRGMGSGKNDYSLAEFGDSLFGGGRLTLTGWERRAEAFVAYYGGRARLNALRDRDGNLILASQNSPTYRFDVSIVGARMDLTDDYQDPRRGFRLEPTLWRSPPQAGAPDYIFLDVSGTAYVPIGRRSTWAFNLLESDATVLHRGETDLAALARQQGLDCRRIPDAAGAARCREYLADLAAANMYGTASMLGGTRRLRSYPEARYKGAHAQFFGSELRWNLTDEPKPFDIFFMRDIRTAVQVAFFYEIGSVADTRGEMWNIARSSYGAGLRVVTASGLVYRLDFAHGEEGFQPNIFFQYPWEL